MRIVSYRPRQPVCGGVEAKKPKMVTLPWLAVFISTYSLLDHGALNSAPDIEASIRKALAAPWAGRCAQDCRAVWRQRFHGAAHQRRNEATQLGLAPHQRQEGIARLHAGETQADVARSYAVDPRSPLAGPRDDISAFLQWGRWRLRCCSLAALLRRRSHPRGLWRNNYSSSRSYGARPAKGMPRMAYHRCRASAA